MQRFLSRTEHVKLGLNPGGPPSKAKYDLATDSAEYREGKVKRTQSMGVQRPETVCLQAVGARKGDRVPFA